MRSTQVYLLIALAVALVIITRAKESYSSLEEVEEGDGGRGTVWNKRDQQYVPRVPGRKGGPQPPGTVWNKRDQQYVRRDLVYTRVDPNRLAHNAQAFDPSYYAVPAPSDGRMFTNWVSSSIEHRHQKQARNIQHEKDFRRFLQLRGLGMSRAPAADPTARVTKPAARR